MNKVLQNRLNTSVKFSLPDFPGFTEKPKNFKLIQVAGNQDIIEVKFPYQSKFYLKALKTGTLMYVEWKTEAATGKFYGYIYDVTPKAQKGVDREVLVKAVGSAFGLKESDNKIWINKTATQIVEEIAKKFNLKAKVTPHKTILSQQSMLNHTYWEKIQELARRIGYVAQAYGTELHFHPLDVMIDQSMTTIPLMSFFDAEFPKFNAPYEHTLDSFFPTVGDATATSLFAKKEKTIAGIDQLTGRPYSTSSSPADWKKLRKNTKDPLFKESLTTTISANANMAQMVTEAQAKLSRYSIFAEGTGQGDPRIAPYRTIEVSGTGDITDGYWVITRVEHFVTWYGKYEVEFKCMSDGTGRNQKTAERPESASRTPTRNVEYEIRTGNTSRPTTTRISAKAAMVNQTQGGFKLTPRRWEGR